ncbi:DUF3087 domain-containing protein [Shewanella japonica]|uniref:DUF3087 domain-containing protein n=1 Tax=Shewanella japonica TaxID=93973 RepID=A0ABN4YGG5_9GAMM|nr:DUF3087 domain-containing protein [Shewanella japonica]ARD23581.1 hypothetical protein SJ2017_3321 [Shewanella japonica]
MKLISINKQQYRQQLNRLLIGLVSCLTLLSLGFGAILIAFFGQTPVAGSESTGNFHLNLMGVILAVVFCSLIMNIIKTKPFMHDIYWVWQMKQLHNRIYRKLTKIVAAADKNEPDAITILLFYYHTQKQVYELDNNTLTLDAVNQNIQKVESQIAQLNLSISLDDFDIALLDKV